MATGFPIVMALALVALVALSGCVQKSLDEGQDLNASAQGAEGFGNSSLPALQGASAETVGKSMVDRSSYGEGWFFNADSPPTRRPVQEAFIELPEPPMDFDQKVGELVQSRNYAEFSQKARALGEEYYVQPEFLPNFGEIGLQYWKNPDLNHWGIYGVGFFPSDEEFNLKPGEEIEAVAFYHSGWYIQTYQGARLQATFSQEALGVQVEPEGVLLEPTYPVMGRGWMKKVIVRIRASQNATQGTYEVGINPVQPDPATEAEWAGVKGKYVPVSGQNAIGRDRLRVTVRVK